MTGPARQEPGASDATRHVLIAGTGAIRQADIIKLILAERIRDSIADHDEIRGIIGEAAVQPAGSAPWWRTVRTVMAVSAEHLENEERDVLPNRLSGLSMSLRKQLGRQWCAFMAAWGPDATLGPPGRSSSGPAA